MIHYITTNGIGNAWVANELHQVDLAGIPFVLHTMRRPGSHYHESAWARRIEAETRVIYPLRLRDVIGALFVGPALFHRRFLAALGNALFGRREHIRARLASLVHLIVACHWAVGLRREPVSHIHAQWVHSSGTIGMYGAWLLGVSFSFTGHATDLFRDRVALADKIRRAAFIICISTFHRDFYIEQGARSGQLHLAYCGIDPQLFSGTVRTRRARDPLRILAAGRLVEKKGFAHLIDACDHLARRGIEFHCMIAGNGPTEPELRQRVIARGLRECITITGEPLKQERIPDFMATGDIFCLPCVWAADDDVDGLPQILMEAMACGLPAVSTRLVGIPDLVIDEETGLLVEPARGEQLADTLHRLRDNPALAGRLAAAGQRHVRERFDIHTSLEPLLTQFERRLPADRGPTGRSVPVYPSVSNSRPTVPPKNGTRRATR